MYIVGEGPCEMAKLPLALSCLSYLINSFLTDIMGFPVAWTVKSLPAVRKTRVQSLGQEDRPAKEMATNSSILAWKIPWMEEPGWLLSMGSQRVGHD